jgi:hypothetical protein
LIDEINYKNIEQTFFKGLTPIYAFVRDSLTDDDFSITHEKFIEFLESAAILLKHIKEKMENGKYTDPKFTDWHADDGSDITEITQTQKDIEEFQQKIDELKGGDKTDENTI